MKKFNLKEAAKNLNEKLKNDKKFKARFATLTVAGVIVIATAITVPTVVHNNKIKAEENTTNVAVQAEPETETTTLPDGVETTVDAEGHVVPVTDESGNFVYTTATPETTIAAIESTAANVNNNTNNTAGGNKGSSSNTGSSNNKSTGGKKNTGNSGGSQQQGTRPVTEADVKAIVEEAKAYARNKYGFVIDSSLTEVGTSWGPELGITKEFEPGDNKLYAEHLRDRIDSTYKRLREDYRWKPPVEQEDGTLRSPGQRTEKEMDEMVSKYGIGSINIFYKYRPNDSAEPYYIYVVF